MLTYEQFKSKLEDQCIWAINVLNKKISNQRYYLQQECCCCPLGSKGYINHPTYLAAANEWDIHPDHARAFICGFEIEGYIKIPYIESNKFYELGKLYRNKYVYVAKN